MSGNQPSSKEEIERQVYLQVRKVVWPFAKKFPENPQTGKDGRVGDLHLKNEIQKEWSPNALKDKQTRNSSGRNLVFKILISHMNHQKTKLGYPVILLLSFSLLIRIKQRNE
ncbi:hypothetical protein ACFX2B_023493 [Malus domestica]